jgi:hypothetical protein
MHFDILKVNYRMLRIIFGPKREEMVGGWRRLHEGLHNLYTSPNIIRVIKSRRRRWLGHVAHTGDMRNVYKLLVRKPEGKKPFRRSKHGWEDNIRMDLKEIGREGMYWMHLPWERDQWWALVNTVMILQVL